MCEEYVLSVQQTLKFSCSPCSDACWVEVMLDAADVCSSRLRDCAYDAKLFGVEACMGGSSAGAGQRMKKFPPLGPEPRSDRPLAKLAAEHAALEHGWKDV
jgi:hypothetical protein